MTAPVTKLSVDEDDDDDLSFKYNSLDTSVAHVRLLSLDPDQDFDARICCSLTGYPIGKQTHYEALSYTWTDQPPSQTISINGFPFRIRPNLAETLRYLRHKSHHRLLWVDAICIDQSDLKDKSLQLPLMHSIFASADRVLVWLGCSDEDVESMFEDLSCLTDNGRNVQALPGDLDRDFMARFPGMRKIFANSWFTRMWTVQELVVADRDPLLIFGYHQLPWNVLSTVIYNYGRFATDEDDHLGMNMTAAFNTYLLRRIWHLKPQQREVEYGDRLGLGSLLNATADRACTDPRDKVFAVLGMLPPEYKSYVLQNYEVPVSKVYQSAMVEALITSGDLKLLMNVVYSKEANVHNLPAWCLDFSTLNWSNYRNAFSISVIRTKLNATNRMPFPTTDLGRTFELMHNISQNSLTVIGATIGKIQFQRNYTSYEATENSPEGKFVTSLGEEDLLESPSRHCGTIFRCWTDLWPNFHTTLVARLGLVKANELLQSGVVWAVFSGGKAEAREETFINLLKSRGSYRDTLPSLFELIELYMRICALEKAVGDDVGAKTSEIEPSAYRSNDSISGKDRVDAMMKAILDISIDSHGKDFFGTDTGLVGRADHPIEDDDVLCVLQRCPRPVILRPCADGSYRLVTFAYAHDVFEESETTLNLQNLKGDWFELC